MLRKFAFSLSLLIAVAGCAHTSAHDIAHDVELHGRLTLRGNEPFVYPVVADTNGVWRLEGIGRAQATALQNRIVRIIGNVTDETTGEQTMHVRSITVDDAASN
jgi:hypothetical protein